MAYMSDVFNGYQNLLNGISNMVVHEWTFDLNIGMENLNFCIDGVSILMDCHCLDYAFYVLVI
jgi:hypothetical protein